ncbi:hypothetical protein LguiB_028100 [Lonicera macranthoides]
MDLADTSLDASLMAALHDLLELSESGEKPHPPSRAYIRDSKAMKATPADILECPNEYNFIVDMPGLKPDQIKVHVEDGNVLVVSGERRREKDKEKERESEKGGGEGVKYVRMERRLGKFLKKFVLGENADTEKISAEYKDGVLTVVVEKRPPPKPRSIEVKVGSSA